MAKKYEHRVTFFEFVVNQNGEVFSGELTNDIMDSIKKIDETNIGWELVSTQIIPNVVFSEYDSDERSPDILKQNYSKGRIIFFWKREK